MKLSALVDEVGATDEGVMITRNGAPAAVLISPNALEGWRETMAIRFDRESMAEVRAGLAALQGGQVTVCTLDELFGD